MLVNRYARWGVSQGLVQGDIVCLLMSNKVEYVAIWLGLTRIGCTVSLLNTNLRGDALIHCINVAQANTLIYDDLPLDLIPPVKNIFEWKKILPDLPLFSPKLLTNIALPSPSDHALLIYTSGTTGLPKATIITHRRITEWSFWFAGLMDTQPSDRLYNCLPMYHSVGGVVAIGSMLVKGGSVYISERFSVSHFWDEIINSHCTIFQYIGELCRYLTLSQSHPKEQQHQLRLACGNGMQEDVWIEFQKRFAIPHVLEFYAATEGNLSLYNCEGKPGAIGRVPSFLANRFSVTLIQCDPDTAIPLRDENGFCIKCDVEQPGEAISQIDQNRKFDGYTDPISSQKKLLQNVFMEGDCWFRSGDLMRKDVNGYYYFVDRLGDTFRWKGENVSTTEVAGVLRQCVGVQHAVVYGVKIPGNEGRAGMAAITVDDRFDFPTLNRHLKKYLPDYACPMFVRLCDSLDTTGTFKLSKTELMRQGYTEIPDLIYIRGRDRCFTPIN
jgi:fatty-acyl-CoA synthase